MKSKIKICHIAHKLTGKSDGVFTHLKMLFELLDKNQFEQVLMYSGNEPLIDSYMQSLGIKVYNIPELNKKLPIKLFFKIFRILRKENVDIIHTHLVKPYIFAGLINLILNRKLIFNYQGIFFTPKYYSILDRTLLNLLNLILGLNKKNVVAIAPSKLSLEELKKNSVSFKDIFYYYNGYVIKSNPPEINPVVLKTILSLKRKFFLVGLIARHEKQKRLDLALKILLALTKKGLNIFFIFIGDGPLLNQTKKLSKDYLIEDKCLFIEHLKNLPDYLHLFDVILFTSEWEGFPLTIWEAMYNSVPVVSSDVGGIREILEGENCGIVYPFNDLERCVEIITDLYYNREKLKILGENGRKAILEKYNEKQFKQFFEQLYIDLADEK